MMTDTDIIAGIICLGILFALFCLWEYVYRKTRKRIQNPKQFPRYRTVYRVR